MSEDHTQQPDPTHPAPLFAPVRPAVCGFTLRMFRERDGSRCAVAFTSAERLHAVLGAEQQWIPLAEAALRELAQPLGVGALVVDPSMVAPAVPETPALPCGRSWETALADSLPATAPTRQAELRQTGPNGAELRTADPLTRLLT